MTLQFADRIEEIIGPPGTGVFTLGTPVSSYLGFSNIPNIATGDTVYYIALDVYGDWEIGLGTFTSGGTLANTLSRGVITSSNNNQVVDFTDTIEVGCIVSAEFVNGLITSLATLNTEILALEGTYSSITTEISTIYGSITTINNDLGSLTALLDATPFILSSSWVGGTLSHSQELMFEIIPFDLLLPAQMSNSYAGSSSPPVQEQVQAVLLVNGNSITTATWPVGTLNASYSTKSEAKRS